MNLIGARPARFRRLRVLVVGCGDVGQRAVRELGAAYAQASGKTAQRPAHRNPDIGYEAAGPAGRM